MTDRRTVVLESLRDGKITQEEADYYLRAVCDTTLEQANATSERPAQSSSPKTSSFKTASVALVVLIALVAVAGSVFWAQDAGLTGFAVLDITGGDTPVVIPLSTAVRVSGTLVGEGEATLYLDTDAGTLVIAYILSDDGTPRTDKPSYAAGEMVDIEHNPSNAAYYLDDGTQSTAVSVPFAAPSANSTLLIVADTSAETTQTYRLPIVIGNAARRTLFADVCVDTCEMEAVRGTLRVDASPGTTVELARVDTQQVVNRAPTQIAAIPAQTLETAATIDVSPYFTDPDGDELLYSAGSSSVADITVNGSFVQLSPRAPGAESITIYVSDMHELISATLEVTVIANASDEQENASVTNTTVANQTLQNSTNETILANETAVLNVTTNDTSNVTLDVADDNVTVGLNETPNATNTTAPSVLLGLDCSDVNPNARPLDCIQTNASYFEENIYLENIQRLHVARVTPIGNLVIRGRAYELSTGEPSAEDFTVGYKDEDFNYRPTIWIDTEGNLRTIGIIHEEQENLLPSNGAYGVMNRRGVYLLYADPHTGDIWLRGNIIMFREDIDG